MIPVYIPRHFLYSKERGNLQYSRVKHYSHTIGQDYTIYKFLRDDIIEWMEDNVHARIQIEQYYKPFTKNYDDESIITYVIEFEDEAEAILFKMRWL